MIKIGYTTGVFDMFHIGHLNIIKQSKENCDFLIVGVTSDEEVMRVKNKKTIIPLEQRIKIVEAIKYVDKVIIEDDVDKIKAWNEIHYDILFKGSDWKNSSEFTKYENFFFDKGVEICFFEYTPGISSSKIREKLNL